MAVSNGYTETMRACLRSRNQISLQTLLAAVAVAAVWLCWAKAVGGTIEEIKRRRMAAEIERAAARQDFLDAVADQQAAPPKYSSATGN